MGPCAARARGMWAMLRLHKHAAILTAKDSEALAELLHADAARPLIGPLISPTVAWIDHQRVEDVRELLRRAGYTPRVTQDSVDVPDST